MILIDTNNMFFSEFLEYQKRTGEQMTMDLIRRLGVSKLSRVMKEHKAFGRAILCADDRRYWRKDVFPFYKASRKKGRDDSTFDWATFFPLYEKFLVEIQENLPILYIRVDGAEADDVIAILSLRYINAEDVLIWSSDTDDLQLQQIEPRIKQFSYKKKKMITPKSEGYTLFEHIVKGDAGDGIPNILSDEDILARQSANPELKLRQKSVMAAKLLDWANHGVKNPEKFCDAAMLKRFKTNEKIIDYRHIPEDVASRIVEKFESVEGKAPKGKVFNYLIEKQLTNVLRDGF